MTRAQIPQRVALFHPLHFSCFLTRYTGCILPRDPVGTATLGASCTVACSNRYTAAFSDRVHTGCVVPCVPSALSACV